MAEEETLLRQVELNKTNTNSVNKTGEEEKDTQQISYKLNNTDIDYDDIKDIEHKENSNSESILLESVCDINKADWKTPGDRELRTITHFDGTKETLWFSPKNKFYHKKLFISFSIDRINVNNEEETFRMKFRLQFNWISSEQDYKSHYKAAVLAAKLDKAELLLNWKPSWIPSLEFNNLIETHIYEWRPHPKVMTKGPFRVSQYKQFGPYSSETSKMYRKFDFSRIKWICAELECDMTFGEELELQSYPFDYQDLSTIFTLRQKETTDYSVFTYPNFFNPECTATAMELNPGDSPINPTCIGFMDPSLWQIDEWQVENCLLELEFKRMVISLKLSRRWKPILINTLLVIFLVCLLSLTVFAISFENIESRLELTLTLILTAVLFDVKSAPKPYLTFLDKYILTSYGYLTLVMIENSLGRFFDEDFDENMFVIIVIIFLSYHIIFICYAKYVHNRERKKVFMKYDQVKNYNKKLQKPRPKLSLSLNETNIMENGGTNNKYKRSVTVGSRQWN